ncbi:MAG: hypothetical protein KatS3mg015_1085 [Fimbriimonadales bacterium]|nr:MAG: hypothetical protein KatS3mg015_1085 [Fimbriimonadales bacterium]
MTLFAVCFAIPVPVVVATVTSTVRTETVWVGSLPADPLHPIVATYEDRLIATISKQEIATVPIRDITLRPGYDVKPFMAFGAYVPAIEQGTENLSWELTPTSEAPDASFWYQTIDNDLNLPHWESFRVGLNPAYDFEVKGYALSDGLERDGWTRSVVNQKRYDLSLGIKYERVQRVGGMENVETVSEFQIKMGARYEPSEMDRTFEADSWGASGLEAIGGLRFTPEYTDKLGRSEVLFPPVGAKYDVRNPFGATPSRYLNDVGRILGQDEVRRMIGSTGLELPRLSGMLESAAASGEDMNRLQFPGDPDGLEDVECGSEFVAPPGTLWVPSDPSYQTMMSFTGLTYKFGPELREGGAPYAEMRTHCLSMNKKEPAPNVRYYPYAPNDTMLPMLAKLAEQSRFRGPWDQARTWIYTDRAGFAEINKRLFPPVSSSRYVDALYDVALYAGLQQSDLEDRKFFPLDALDCSASRDDAGAWYIHTVATNFARDLRRYLESAPQALTKLASGDELDRKHLVRLSRVLLAHPEKDARMGVLQFLMKLNTTQGIEGRLGLMLPSLLSSDEKEVELALDVCRKYAMKDRLPLLRVMAAKGATEPIRSKAASLVNLFGG